MVDHRTYVPRREGTPQGGPLSPLLANVVLHELDSELEQRGLRCARYADDVLILAKSPRAARRVLASVQRWLRETLRLELNETKSRVARLSACTFLGFLVRQGRIAISEASKVELKRRARELTNRHRGLSFERYVKELNAYVSGWTNSFALSETFRDWRMWDEWIRRRLRLVCLTHWKWPKTRFRRLIELGAPRFEPAKISESRSGPW
ncbi:MAG: reverse transcriptase domain-containing protein [Opitutales bacterium]